MNGWIFVVVCVAACGGGSTHPNDAAPDAGPGSGACDVLAQTGCTPGARCTWIQDGSAASQGHIGCAFGGSAAIDAPCTRGSDGIDDCVSGAVCTDVAGAAMCRQICDLNDVGPLCDGAHACFEGSVFFNNFMRPAAGTCETRCDPLADNDFDGSGSALTRAGSSCGSDLAVGCYGLPHEGQHPATGFVCLVDRGVGTNLFHRSVVPSSGAIPIDVCHQGYQPLFFESTGSTSVVCVALCQPQNCYAGNCGSADENRFGVAPHRCMAPDAVGAFDTSTNGDECTYLWSLEQDATTGQVLHSRYSDSVGVCFDHSLYRDLSGNMLPACQQLQLQATGTDPSMPLTYYSAVDLGCVDSATAGLFTGKPADARLTGIRAPYPSAMR